MIAAATDPDIILDVPPQASSSLQIQLRGTGTGERRPPPLVKCGSCETSPEKGAMGDTSPEHGSGAIGDTNPERGSGAIGDARPD